MIDCEPDWVGSVGALPKKCIYISGIRSLFEGSFKNKTESGTEH